MVHTQSARSTEAPRALPPTKIGLRFALSKGISKRADARAATEACTANTLIKKR